jgi:hypothetical protein
MRFVRCLIVALMIIPAAGCGQRSPLVPVTGVVLLGTHPVEGASVTFLSDVAGALPAAGTTDADGRFRLKTYLRSTKKDHDGAAVGAYRVVIAKLSWPNLGGTPSGGTPSGKARVSTVPTPKNDLPERYNSDSTSGFVAEVRSGSVNDFTFVIE